MTNTTNTDKPTAYTVRKDPKNDRKWYVINPQGHKVRDVEHTTRREAKADADARTAADAAEWEASAKQADAPAPVQSINPPADDGLSNLAKQIDVAVDNAGDREREAIREWVQAGRKGKRPETPVLDVLLADEKVTIKVGRAPRTPRTPGVAQSRTPEQQARFVAIITEARDAGGKWHQAAKQLTAEGIPTSKGGGWYYSTVQGLAKSMGLI